MIIENELKKAENDLVKGILFQNFFSNSGIAILIMESDMTISNISIIDTNLFGYSKEEIEGKMVWPYIIFPVTVGYLEIMRLHSDHNPENGILEYECKITDNRGCLNHLIVRSELIKNTGLSILTILNFTTLRENKKRIEYYDLHDNLTGLFNRKMLRLFLQIELEKAERHKYQFAIMCIGIDRMKEINEHHGLKTGDRCLIEIGKRISRTFRQGDFTARLYGDKFIVLLSDIKSFTDVNLIIEKTQQSISGTCIEMEEKGLLATASIGVCLYPEDGDNGDLLIKYSETAMYLAKEKGINSYQLFNNQLHKNLQKKTKLEKELYQAVKNNEFVFYFQPIVDRKGQVVFMEVLARWQSPVHGLLGPSEFISITEKNGLIVDIGYYGLRTTCEQMMKWQMNSLFLNKLAVNISPVQFAQKSLVPEIKKIIRETGINPCWLELEITESGIMSNEEETISKLQEIHEMGISISIDDFGTGYSSMSRLKDFPVRTLKIDKSFVDDMISNEKSSTIITSIINLAHDLGFNVIGEGVETVEQFETLIFLGCDFFQGYYFSKPGPSEEIEKLLTRKKSKLPDKKFKTVI
ncbi:MAG: bifunctional diguanylate cyclase/phosphodiesterase [Spirochaetaceae bacterium]|nr:bifunctional diguanylate cyclase/phosphodiesterase [Spirochaetaceae bacterium]